MLLLRPSPAIPHPSHDSLEVCQQSATAIIRTFHEMYSKDLLPYTWSTVHSVFLATLSMLYCIWTVPNITRATKLETLTADLKSASGVLSALGEHWLEAKRSRVLLDELSQTTIRWLVERQPPGSTTSVQTVPGAQNIPTRESHPAVSLTHDGINGIQTIEEQAGLGSSTQLLNATCDPLASMFSFLDETNSAFDIDSIMLGVFSEYQPDVESGQSFPLENQTTCDFAV